MPRNHGGNNLTTDENLREIKKLIDHMQSGLAEIFSQLRELRRRLDLVEDDELVDSSQVIPLFTRVTTSIDAQEPDITEIDETPKSSEEVTSSEKDDEIETPSVDVLVSEEPETTESITPPPETQPLEETPPESPEEAESKIEPIAGARVSRLLDPIAHELRTGEATADVIAEFLQAAKDDLLGEASPNDRVARDIDVVLRFLKARGKRGIRTDERENILKRIARWKSHLTR